jgi:hypothetical protein
MSDESIIIESVVREVLAELAAVAKNNGQAMADSHSERSEESTSASEILRCAQDDKKPVPTSPESPAPPPGDLTVAARVVTMAEVSGRLGSIRRLVVSREAIVTPAVRDELLRHGIALGYADSTNGRAAPLVRVAIFSTGTDFDPAALVAGLTRDGLKIEHAALNCLIASADQLAAELAKPDTLGVLLTRYTAAGLCLANRLRGVRAVIGADAPAVASAAAAIGANLLVADPNAGTFFQLKQMVAEFCRGGVRPCPEVFRTRLA